MKDNESITNALNELEAKLPCDEHFNDENMDPNMLENSDKGELKYNEDKANNDAPFFQVLINEDRSRVVVQGLLNNAVISHDPSAVNFQK